MNINHSKVIFFLVVLCLSQDMCNAIESTPSASLKISPSKCMIENKEKSCNSTIVFTFSDFHKGKHCLYRIDEKVPLFCFDNRNYQHSLNVSTTSDIVYVVIEELTKLKITSVNFTRFIYKPAKLNKRRRRSWGII